LLKSNKNICQQARNKIFPNVIADWLTAAFIYSSHTQDSVLNKYCITHAVNIEKAISNTGITV
jgi:hypothetical protein